MDTPTNGHGDERPPAVPLPPPPPPVPTFPTPPGVGPRATTGSLASPLRRLGARLVDGLVIGLPMVIVFTVAFAAYFEDGRPSDEAIFQMTLIATAVGALYEIVLIHLRGQTLGKMAVGIKVIQVEDGRPPSWNRASIRYALPALAGFIPVAGGLLGLVVYLWLLWDPQRQGLHDKAARTIVVMA